MTPVAARSPSAVSLPWLLFGVFGGPAAWVGQLITTFAVASYPCFPGGVSRTVVLPGWGWVWPVVLVLNLVALAAALAAAAVSLRIWRATGDHHPLTTHGLLAGGAGWPGFLAACGIMTGVVFFAAIVFDTVALFVVPTCAG